VAVVVAVADNLVPVSPTKALRAMLALHLVDTVKVKTAATVPAAVVVVVANLVALAD
jgi:hypothetical protein